MKLASTLLSLTLVLAPAAHAFAQEKPGEEKKDDGEKKPGDAPAGPRRRPGGPGGPGQPFALPTDVLKEKLALSEEQVKKLETINQEMMDDAQKGIEEARKDPNYDFAKMREGMTKAIQKVRDKIRGILTDEQKPKFEEFVKQEDARYQQQGQGWRRSPEEQKKRLYDRAEKELVLTSEEKAAVMPLVQKVLDVRSDARVADEKRKEEFTSFVKKASSGTEDEKAAVAAKLADLRKAREADKAKIKEAQAALREVLTIENEARLVADGVLED